MEEAWSHTDLSMQSIQVAGTLLTLFIAATVPNSWIGRHDVLLCIHSLQSLNEPSGKPSVTEEVNQSIVVHLIITIKPEQHAMCHKLAKRGGDRRVAIDV